MNEFIKKQNQLADIKRQNQILYQEAEDRNSQISILRQKQLAQYDEQKNLKLLVTRIKAEKEKNHKLFLIKE